MRNGAFSLRAVKKARSASIAHANRCAATRASSRRSSASQKHKQIVGVLRESRRRFATKGCQALTPYGMQVANLTIRDGDARRSCGPVGPIRRMEGSVAAAPVPIVKTMGEPTSLKK
jgi:hypothetical protein